MKRFFLIMLFTLRPLSEHTGAEILDIDLKSNHNKAVIKKLNQVFSKFFDLQEIGPPP